MRSDHCCAAVGSAFHLATSLPVRPKKKLPSRGSPAAAAAAPRIPMERPRPFLFGFGVFLQAAKS
jgi:hypothetical protein